MKFGKSHCALPYVSFISVYGFMWGGGCKKCCLSNTLCKLKSQMETLLCSSEFKGDMFVKISNFPSLFFHSAVQELFNVSRTVRNVK